MENVHLSLILHFLNSSLRNSIYKSIIFTAFQFISGLPLLLQKKHTLLSAFVWKHPHKGNQTQCFHLQYEWYPDVNQIRKAFG